VSKAARRPAFRTIGAAGAIAAVVLLAVAGGLAWTMFGPGPAPPQGGQSTTVILKRGSSLPQIAQSLAESDVIRLPFGFGLLAKLTGGGQRLRAGEYAIPARASAFDILQMIRAGRIVHHYITIPEGLSSAEVADLLNANPVLSGHAPVAQEGWIMPQTYDAELGEDRSDLVAQMVAAQKKLVARLWADRKPGLPYTSPEQALAMASIVEKETSVAVERAHVAGVYLNRLAKGIRLEADPTIIYGLTRGRPLGRSLTHADVTEPTPWNTYVVAGLPPTPIANPGIAAIEAALDPASTRDLFFVADGTGGHVFSETFEEHSRNVARWRGIAKSLKGD
jgi:UPF0755 protein